MEEIIVYCADIGSKFGWASRTASGTDIRTLVDVVADDLNAGIPVALGFECPLFVPIREDPMELRSARSGEVFSGISRPWSASAGATSMGMGIVQTIWILREVRGRLVRKVPAYLEWQRFRKAGRGLFLWEAFVTGPAKTGTDIDDAKIAVRRFEKALPDVEKANAMHEDKVHSLIGAALIRTDWSTDLSLLKKPCIVIRP